MAMECRVCGGQWWLVPKWAKHFGEPILAYSDTRFPSLKIPIVDEAATNALMEEILEPN